MRLVKEFLNEKFTKDSDPITDLGIGGIDLCKVYDEIEDEATDKWIDFLNNTLKGRTIKATLMRWDGRHSWEERVIRVKRIVNDKGKHSFVREVAIADGDGIIYTILEDKKIYIIE